jgi:hypothetical protein
MTFVLIFLIAAVAGGYIYLVRVEGDRTVRFWAGAWVLFLVWMIINVAAEQMGIRAFTGVIHGMTTLMLWVGAQGAFAYVDRPFPTWASRAAIAAILCRSLLAQLGAEKASFALMLVVDPSIMIMAGLAVMRSVATSGSRVISAGLALTYFTGASRRSPRVGRQHRRLPQSSCKGSAR